MLEIKNYRESTKKFAFSAKRRIEAIYFDYDDIKWEINCFNAMHISNIKEEKLDNIENFMNK